MTTPTRQETSPASRGYLYFIIRSEDMQAPDDATIFIKVGMTKDPRNRISNYITHHVGDSPPIYYKIWQVVNEKLEESLALAHFDEQRITKAGSSSKSEVIRATKAQVEAYSPRDPEKRAIAPHTMLPAEIYVVKYDAAQRFEEHWEELSAIQGRVIAEIVDFLKAPLRDARKLRAPCGTGKTHMTCEAIRQVAVDDASLKVCVLCPTKLIAEQWRGNFYRLGIHAPILTKSDLEVSPLPSDFRDPRSSTSVSRSLPETPGSAASSRASVAREDQTDHRFRIVTYASCPGLRADPTWTYVFDEAHHTCGSIEGDDGITKRLVNETAAAGCRRLFLTFTPKNFSGNNQNSMDDVSLYGTDILFPGMRELVTSGLMPDYKLIMTHRDKMETLVAVSQELKTSRKILVCLQSVKDVEAMQEQLRAYFPLPTGSAPEDTVHIAHSGMPSEGVTQSIESFSNQLGRSWLLTCLVLLEGADIPIADTVVLLAPWKTETRLVQLLLRPGRWYPKKATFNIVVSLDENHLIENNLRAAGFEVGPNKLRHLRMVEVAEPGNVPRSLAEIVKDKHVWAVSYTENSGHNIDTGLNAAETDFANSIAKSQIFAVQRGLDKAEVGHLVMLRGPTSVAFASVLAVRVVLEQTSAGATTRGESKDKKRTIMDVRFLPVRWVPFGAPQRAPSTQSKPITISVEDYRACVLELWGQHKDRRWLCNPHFTGSFKYDAERRAIILRLLDTS